MATKKVNLNNEGELQPEVVLDMLAKRGLIAENAADPERIKKAKQEQKKQAYRNKYGKAFLGNIMLHGRQLEQVRNFQASPIREYTGESIENFSCDFIIPKNDHLLTELIRIFTVTHFYNRELINAIYKRIDDVGGLTFLWT